MTFLTRLRSAWNYFLYMPVVFPTDHEDKWTDEDSAAYSAFMKGPTGLKLTARCKALMFNSAVIATQTASTELAKKCGWSNGIAATFAWLDRHRISPARAQSSKSEGSDGAADILERYAP